MTYALVADCVGKSFGDRRVLTSASLRAVPGEVRSIFGRNGEGKSTLLRIAVGWLAPDTGIVRMGDATFTRASLPDLASRGVFYLPDHELLAPMTKLGRQLGFFRSRYGTRTPEEAAGIARVDHLLDRRPITFSGGELRRAELALAIARRPTVLVADEPYRGITPADHDELTRLFRGLAAEGTAVVITGHDVPSLLAASDHVTWCTNGTTYELGAPDIACANERFRRGYLGPGWALAPNPARAAGDTHSRRTDMPSQRDVMRELYRRLRGDEAAMIRAYAEAEMRGEVARASNAYDIPAEEYARRLLEDARKKGWIRGLR